MKISDVRVDAPVLWRPTRLSRNLTDNFNVRRTLSGVITGTKGNLIWVSLTRNDGSRVSRLISVKELTLVKSAPRPKASKTPEVPHGT